MIAIRRGTTPTITLNLPVEFNPTDVSVAWVTIAQNNEILIDKVTEDVDITADGTIDVPLTQEDTLKLTQGWGDIQLRLLTANGDAVASQTSSVRVLGIIKDGIIE